ncbi:unnamed protein product [Meganyctiphanes norvegica]|uniref:Peptidase S1 domain-containing protein n=1 Tax=Meganyctiphanes norvegica TaxID=48144 RepID=A0AAV2RU91_MEGNR
MYKWIFIVSLILQVCVGANISPVALIANSSASSENNNTNIESSSYIQNDNSTLPDPSEDKIVGGYDATQGEAPWQVGLFSYGSLFCGGTLLSDRVVVTAAHCMGGSFTVRLGGLDRGDLPLEYSVNEVFIHQDYDRSTTDNDIALVILEGAVNVPYLEYVEPTSLPMIDDYYYDNIEDYENQTVLISGWGTISSGHYPLPNTLQAALVQIFSEDICKKSYSGYIYTDNMICAGVEDYSKDSCQGDSGGPLVLKSETSNILLGITSWGIGCAYDGYPGVYTKVTNFISWIEEKACSSNACLNSTMKYTVNSAPIVTISGYLFGFIFSLMCR